MNITKKRSFKMILLIVLLMGVMITSQMMQAMATSTGQTIVEVKNLSELKTAIENAQDGDVITFRSGLTIYSDVVIGDPNKHITLKRLSDTSFLDIKTGNILFQNVTLDGGGFPAMYSMAMINYDVTFDNVTFRNSVNNKSTGGAVSVNFGTATFKNCLFEDNTALSGGHIAVKGSGSTIIANSILKDGYAWSNGGAIWNASSDSTTTITSSLITNNSAGDYGGGLSNKGTMIFSGTKLYDNTAPNGGADIGNTGNLNLADSIEQLIELFKDDGIIPKAWINDYDFEAGIYIPDIDPSVPNTLLKLDYDLAPTEVTLFPSSLGSASDGKIIGLESGKYYKITSNDVVSYSKADGSLTTTESEASPLIGIEIIGLTNGETYMVEEFTPTPITVLLDSASLGTADSGKITGLSADKMYKVSVDGTTNYTKTDGTLTSNEAEAEALTGTEIVGLINGVTYLVEEYIPPVEEEPTDPGTEPTDPDEEDPIEEPIDEEEPTDPPTDEEEPKDPVDQEEPKNEEVEDEDPDQESNTPPTSTTNNTTNSNNTSNTTNNTTNNLTTHNSDSRDDSSTVNNNSYDHSTHTTTENTYLPPSNDGSGEKGGQASASQHQTITVDYGSIADGIKVQEDGKNITINVNVNVDTNEKKEDEAEPQAMEVASSNVEADPRSAASNITWVELVKICLLFGIFICVFRRPIAK
ncbi:hypothetical protein A500_10525 [Clostridium sartagoforme AAU1]|uniref:Uncharacterized protein n=1 Tax=Clostridium sartagoforme AAU1 TaxID=1202534 RepID=R9C8J6_9CLOT|nr:hypothetical protein [Clostridium sartagoforme]EOR25305.1 hypothetical protein A500_10525 [Clostridium sartagoforme AAU1]